MITGKIGVPFFTVHNEKVILRHIFAVALSDFFAKQVDVYNSNNADVLLNGDGWERLCAYLSSKPAHLKEILKASIPEAMHEIMGIHDFSWTEKLIGEDGVLKVAVEEFRGTVQYYIDEYQRLLAQELTQQAAAVEKKLWSYRRGKEDNRGRNELIEFLVRNNVLPKYGFPVDTVELYQNTNTATDKKLQMVRDLQLAISEYIDCYENFGWELDENIPAASQFHTVTLRMKRDRKIVNKMELTRLQRNFEACANEIDKLEQSKNSVATLWSLIVGIIGTVFMAGSVFAVTHEPPIYWLCVLLAVPGFLGWIFPYFVYRHKVTTQMKKVQPIIEAKQDEIYEICKKGHDLL